MLWKKFPPSIMPVVKNLLMWSINSTLLYAVVKTLEDVRRISFYNHFKWFRTDTS